jgi:hypothetical protein
MEQAHCDAAAASFGRHICAETLGQRLKNKKRKQQQQQQHNKV